MRPDKRINYFVLGVLFVLTAGWTYTWDTTTPAGTDAPSVIDNRIREVKQGVQEMLNIDHYFPLTGTQVSDADARAEGGAPLLDLGDVLGAERGLAEEVETWGSSS